ncbi:MAG: FtsX-like permease family protein, partial [Promethearchaeota archaeon]
IGTIFSYFISNVIFTVTLDTISSLASATGFSVSGFDIVLLPTTLIATFVVGLIACVVASLYPSWKASRKPIIECLSPLEEKTKREKRRYTKKILAFIFGGLLITFGVWLLMTTSAPTETSGMGFQGQQNVTVMVGPVIILLGTIWLIALVIRPINRGFIILFSPYLRKTKLLTEKNILRHPRRTILTFSMIALTTSFLIGMSVMMDSMREGVNTTVHNFMGSDARVFTFNTPRSLESDLLTLPGLEDISGVSHQNARIKIDDDWIGHSFLETQYNTSISLNILDTMKMKNHLSKTVIASPSGMSLNEMMDELESGFNIIIIEDFAEDYNVKVSDVLPVEFSLGVTFANLSAMIAMNYINAQEDTIIVNMTVIAIVENFEGFSSLNLFGSLSAGKTYDTFVSWTAYEEIASKNLPGGGTDMVFRQSTQTGDPFLDAVQSNWINFSSVEPILNSIDEISYYTTRMDSYTLASFNGTILTLPTSVIGIQTNSTGKIKSDSFFGNNTLVDQKVGYTGSTMEELLNTIENICVVDETFIFNNPSIGVGDNLTIFPQQYILDTVSAGAFPPYFTTVIPYIGNFSSTSGSEGNLTLSDDVYLSYVSNQEWLAFNITTSFLTPNMYKAVNVTIETSVNSTIDNLELEAFNIYTNSFEKLGFINNTVESNNTFVFDLNHHYFDMMNNVKLRVIGHNSTYSSNYNLTIDSLKFGVARSFYSTNASTWPSFEIVGIIESPTLYNAEKYDWFAGFERGFDASGNSVYISYENARDVVYSDHRGIDYSNDKITSVLLHVDDPRNITTIKSELVLNLPMTGYWSIIDLKSFSLEIRTSVYDWFAWAEIGVSDEEILEEILNYIESEEYLVLFGFTKSFIRSSFRSMIDLIVFIMNGLLILAMVIAMIGLILHSLLSTMARRREIGMLRSIGLSKKGVIRSISGETIIIAFLGIFTGIFSGLIQGSLMVNSMPVGGFITVTFTIPWLTISILIVITLITAILGSRYPAKWAANLNIIDAVRTR